MGEGEIELLRHATTDLHFDFDNLTLLLGYLQEAENEKEVFHDFLPLPFCIFIELVFSIIHRYTHIYI